MVTSDNLELQMIYYVSHGKEEQGLVCHSVACRHLFSLGAHVHPAHRSDRTGPSDDDNISELAEQHLRRLFWIAYWCDGELRVRTVRPPAIDEDYCDLTLPTEPDDDNVATISSLKLALDPRDTTGDIGFGVADLQLSMITTQIGRRLYSASALRKTDAEILCAVRELDDELERWRNLVPEPRRPTLANDQSYLDAEDSTVKLDLEIRSSIRQLNYLHLVTIVHQASSRCRQWAAKDTEARHLQGISISIAISLHASLATLGHMNFVSFHDSVGNIWTVLFFPIAAALNIFCNILLDLLSPSAEGDLELISSTSDLIKRITTASKGHGDAAWCPHLDIFVTELARLDG
jgi:transcription factor-like protein